ncbi:hypothetical protein V6N11_025939 [Hibiscus sabdariffa]|uniref:Phospholipid/glycerol acyltransferase domain-containing protein n=1 Tax=Hibiscus sabdariffa TaxID=183260 RepID=A0ABR2SU68_9ROSI
MAIDVVFSGDDVPQKERVLVVVNHRTEVDRMYPWDLVMRKGFILRSSLMKLPVLGNRFYVNILAFHLCKCMLENDEYSLLVQRRKMRQESRICSKSWFASATENKGVLPLLKNTWELFGRRFVVDTG